MQELQERVSALDNMCKAKKDEAGERSQAYILFQEKYTQVSIFLFIFCLDGDDYFTLLSVLCKIFNFLSRYHNILFLYQ